MIKITLTSQYKLKHIHKNTHIQNTHIQKYTHEVLVDNPPRWCTLGQHESGK